jgi:hypothetical protein
MLILITGADVPGGERFAKCVLDLGMATYRDNSDILQPLEGMSPNAVMVDFRFYVPDDDADDDDPVGKHSVSHETWMEPDEIRAIARRLLAVADRMEDWMPDSPIDPENN